MNSCCPCDERIFPPEPDIPAGLSRLPRQAIGFPEYRQALLVEVRRHSALTDWRAREGDDLGLMMLEWWAYVFDIIAFYDGEIAQNLYLQTATDLGTLRRLVGLIGYHLRPGIAAEAWLAAIADSGPPILVPAGTAFRSEAFDGEAPQTFESDADKIVSKHTNRWTLAPLRRTVAQAGDRLLFEIDTLRLTRGTFAVLSWSGTTTIAKVSAINATRALDGTTYADVITNPPATIPTGVDVASVIARMPTASCGINRWDTAPVSVNTILLDAVYPQIAAGQDVLLSGQTGTELYPVDDVSIRLALPAASIPPLPQLPATQLTVVGDLTSWIGDTSATVFFQFIDAGKLTRPAETRVQRSDLNPSAVLAGVVEPLDPPAPGPFLVQDRDKHGAMIDGTVSVTDAGAGTLTPSSSTEAFAAAMIPPVDIYGNVMHVVRGETVAHEVLGSGNASVAFPSFKLKKKPLTYIADGSAPDGRRSSLAVRVNGILWQEVASFYGTDPDAAVFIVRHDEEKNSFVTFRKLPSGVNNVTASYRFGAGAARPPANTLTQIVRSVKGLARVLNPVAAFGGADPDSIEDIRINGPVSALTLGRAVSLVDFEALARSFGLVNVSAGWAWDASRQRAVVKLWFISESGDVALPLKTFLQAQADPNVPLVVSAATPVPTNLLLDIVADGAYDPADVRASLIAALSDPGTGILSHEHVPIGGTIFRSAIFAAASAVPGVANINSMTVNGSPAPSALTADEGMFLDFLPFTNV